MSGRAGSMEKGDQTAGGDDAVDRRAVGEELVLTR